MADIQASWRAGSSSVQMHHANDTPVLWLRLPDGVRYLIAGKDEISEALSTLASLVEEAQILNGTRRNDQDELIVKAFIDGEGLGQSSAALFHRFIAYRNGVHAHPFNELVAAELAEVDR